MFLRYSDSFKILPDFRFHSLASIQKDFTRNLAIETRPHSSMRPVRYPPVAQRTEQRSSKALIGVRFLSGGYLTGRMFDFFVITNEWRHWCNGQHGRLWTCRQGFDSPMSPLKTVEITLLFLLIFHNFRSNFGYESYYFARGLK